MITLLATEVLLSCSLGLSTAERIVLREREELYRPKLEAVVQIAQEEKAWIRECQGSGGELYMNGGSSINPYFACLAAQGLLSGEVSQEDLNAAQRYIDWHCKKFLKWDGQVPDFRISKGRETTSDPDSTDAYIAVFLSLICRKAELTGTLKAEEKQVLTLGVEKLEALMFGGLTTVRTGDARCYYMDNLEVLEACGRILQLSNQQKGLEDLGKRAGDMARDISAAIGAKLWNPEQRCYEVGIMTDGKIIAAGSLQEFYPGGVAQVYGAFWGFPLSDRELERELYKRFCKDFRWETMEFPDTSFYWSELALAAAEFEDLERAESYLEAYRGLVKRDRSWPLHIGTAGWTAKACGQLAEIYQERLDAGFLLGRRESSE